IVSLFTFILVGNAQKKQLGHEELVTWNRILSEQISPDGNWVVYVLKGEEGDAILKVWNAQTEQTRTFERGENPKISADSRYVVFKIEPPEDSIKAQKHRKVKKEKMTKDTLGILELRSGNLTKIPNVRSFKLPEKWAGWLAWQIEPGKSEKPEPAAADSTIQKKKPAKKENRENGSQLVIRELASGTDYPVEYVTDYVYAEEGRRFMLTSTGQDSTFEAGVFIFDCDQKKLRPLLLHSGDFENLTFDKTGRQAAFHANLDTTDKRIPPFGLFYWKDGAEAATVLADTTAAFLPSGWRISEDGRPSFSDDGTKLFFGMAPNPILPDTSLLDDEIVEVEVWSWTDEVLHTEQNNDLEQEKKRTYQVVWHVPENKFVPLGNLEVPEIRMTDEGNAPVALGYNENPYRKAASWEGWPYARDLYLIDLKTGTRTTIGKAIRGNARLSPKGNFVYWFSAPDTAWFAWSVRSHKLVQMTNNQEVAFFNELNDTPNYPGAYGVAGWTKDDRYVIIYDRYDLWKTDPTGKEAPVNLTNGRSDEIRFRYVQLDPEARYIRSDERILLHVFDEKTKESGYAIMTGLDARPDIRVKEKFQYESRLAKAREADRLLFTKENFEVFPDLRYSDFSFRNVRRVSHANPQQKDYAWGTAELYYWTDLNGNRLTGMLFKPEGFDPSKKYPMIVNFYEKSSDRLFRHHAPSPGRSTINYSFYVSRGYLIFNPDVPYREGYPGESCVSAVVSGVASLIDEGFVDKDRIGVQGHSWGGYQIAYLLTKTNIFRCAEAGAPVVNMFSAYGGIRWGSGLSRMFQYEKTQSRIGGTIWEYPLRYLENSPIFFLDKVETPVLIMHNDHDGAVPWYQGIEYFVGLRRLGKPAWLLNYNGEPHWALKLQNRKDFNIRMQQFFDYYLKDAPMPKWMARGVPAIEKGIDQGYEYIRE
ncbi:MAG: S9 family peptidase, partial [Bacteroidetes bacterium]